MNLLKGWIGEMKTSFYLWFSLSKNTYHRYHNLILPSKNGTTQIDHLLVSVYGLFIIETKNKKGWIFGSEHQENWTQSIYGNKYTFQNPLKQTFRQQAVLSEFLNIDKSKIQPVIYFVYDSVFATPLPQNVINYDVGNYIKTYQNVILSPENVNQIDLVLKNHITNSTLSTRDHLNSLRHRHTSTTVCPNCGSKLIERTSKKGVNASTKFLGCQNYPKCIFTKDF